MSAAQPLDTEDRRAGSSSGSEELSLNAQSALTERRPASIDVPSVQRVPRQQRATNLGSPSRSRRATKQMAAVAAAGPSAGPRRTKSFDHEAVELVYSPVSSGTRLFRQHSFTALLPESPRSSGKDLPRCRSVDTVRSPPSAAVEQHDSASGSLEHLRSPAESDMKSHTGGETRFPDANRRVQSPGPVSHQRTISVHSPISGLYVSMSTAKNYFLSPVAPPYMPTSENHSFFENIFDSSDSDREMVCQQCRHRTPETPLVPSTPTITEEHAPAGLPHIEPLSSTNREQNQLRDVPASPGSRTKRRRRERGSPVVIVANESENFTGSPAPASVRRCCVHTDGSCGKYCRLHIHGLESWEKEKEDSVHREKDKKLHSSSTFAFNFLTLVKDTAMPLFTFDEVPEWQKYNAYIRAGYRSYYTTQMTLRSLIGWHNETFNVWSHFIGFIAFAVLSVVLYCTTLSSLVTVPELSSSRVVYATFCFGSMLCMFNSSMYHLFTGHRKLRIFTLMGRLDFLGITILIVTSFLPPLYIEFHCHTNFRAFYMCVICLLGTAGVVGPWTQAFHSQVWLRTATYLAMGFSGVVPALHALYILPLGAISPSFFTSQVYGILLMAGLYATGVVFYVAQFPERYFPGKFDFMLSSHQIWHFFVLMAAVVHYCNVVSMYQTWALTDGWC